MLLVFAHRELVDGYLDACKRAGLKLARDRLRRLRAPPRALATRPDEPTERRRSRSSRWRSVASGRSSRSPTARSATSRVSSTGAAAPSTPRSRVLSTSSPRRRSTSSSAVARRRGGAIGGLVPTELELARAAHSRGAPGPRPRAPLLAPVLPVASRVARHRRGAAHRRRRQLPGIDDGARHDSSACPSGSATRSSGVTLRQVGRPADRLPGRSRSRSGSGSRAAMRAINLFPSRRSAKPSRARRARSRSSAPRAVPLIAVVLVDRRLLLGALGGEREARAARDRERARSRRRRPPCARAPRIRFARPASSPSGRSGWPRSRLVLGNEVAWDTTLLEVARVLPANVWLTSLTATSPTPADAVAVARRAHHRRLYDHHRDHATRRPLARRRARPASRSTATRTPRTTWRCSPAAPASSDPGQRDARLDVVQTASGAKPLVQFQITAAVQPASHAEPRREANLGEAQPDPLRPARSSGS